MSNPPTKIYTGTIVEESLEDKQVLQSFTITSTRATENPNPRDRWHLHQVEGTEAALRELADYLKPTGWYAHFWSGDDMLVVFHKKVFTQKVSDPSTWDAAIAHGLSIGIPREQLDFLIA